MLTRAQGYGRQFGAMRRCGVGSSTQSDRRAPDQKKDALHLLYRFADHAPISQAQTFRARGRAADHFSGWPGLQNCPLSIMCVRPTIAPSRSSFTIGQIGGS